MKFKIKIDRVFAAVTALAFVLLLPFNAAADSSCFKRSTVPYIVPSNCIDAELLWHSTYRYHPVGEREYQINEIIIDQQWWGVTGEEVSLSRLLLIGMGDLDEVPITLAIPVGYIVFDKHNISVRRPENDLDIRVIDMSGVIVDGEKILRK